MKLNTVFPLYDHLTKLGYGIQKSFVYSVKTTLFKVAFRLKLICKMTISAK